MKLANLSFNIPIIVLASFILWLAIQILVDYFDVIFMCLKNMLAKVTIFI